MSSRRAATTGSCLVLGRPVGLANAVDQSSGQIAKPDYGTVGFVVGDFVGDKRADVFFADGQNWWVSDGGTGPFELYATSSAKLRDLAFGDFDGGGKTEVASVIDNQWMYVPSQGPHQWTRLRSELTDTMNGLIVADFDGDEIADIAMPLPSDWRVSLGGRDDLQLVPGLQALSNVIAIGRFDDRPAPTCSPGKEIIGRSRPITSARRKGKAGRTCGEPLQRFGACGPNKKGGLEAALSVRLQALDLRSPMPPMPPPPGIAGARLLLRHFGDHRLGGDEEAGDRGRVLQRGAHDLGRIDDAGLDHVDVLFGLGVEAPVLRLVLA